ncbi:ornithine carbamoyltransferase [Allomyces javanicus]|nr:ornithine carbamoyltransferase [Allomyces javanicus]
MLQAALPALTRNVAPHAHRPATIALGLHAASFSTSRAQASSGLGRGPSHLLSLQDMTPNDLASILSTALKFKQQARAGTLQPSLKGKSLAMIFSKRSTRTRVAAETAMALLGGHALFLTSADIQMGTNESVRDTAAVLSGMVDGIFARVDAHRDLMALRTHANIPVINGLSDDYHPTQALADLLTMYETVVADDILGAGAQLPDDWTVPDSRFDPTKLHGRKVAWVGDGNNVCHSLVLACAKVGLNATIAAPRGYTPKPSIVAEAARMPVVTHSPIDAVRGADFVFTDCWVSMGQEAEAAARRKAFKGFKVTRDLIHAAGPKAHWRFLHCLPRKNDEVDDAVFYGRESVVFREAHNRKWTIMAVLHHALGVGSWQE